MEEYNLHEWKFRVVIFSVVGIILLLALWLWFSLKGHGAEEYPLSWFIITAAIAGSIVNESFRKAKLSRPTFTRILLYMLWKCSISIVFAIMFYLLVIGGLVGGEMFPNFVARPLEEGAYWDMKLFLTGVEPASYKDIAKILIWSFIAGYAERFVPNLIGKMINSAEGDQSKHRVITGD